jgi:hypothetical protein
MGPAMASFATLAVKVIDVILVALFFTAFS